MNVSRLAYLAMFEWMCIPLEFFVYVIFAPYLDYCNISMWLPLVFRVIIILGIISGIILQAIIDVILRDVNARKCSAQCSPVASVTR